MSDHHGQPAGDLLRDWRQRRNLSQLDLASRADVSTRHLSYVETGRSQPTSGMILRLCRHLDVPLREQNRVLLAGGFAPAHPEHRLSDPPMAEANAALEAILRAHLPYPALVIDRHWELVAANDAAYGLLDGVDPALLEPPVNVIRLSVHPGGLAPRVVNLDEWRAALTARLRREYDATADPALRDLADEVGGDIDLPAAPAALVVPLQLRVGDTVLSFISTSTVFGTPREVTLSELAIEAFYPADQATRRALHAATDSSD
ncbi:helix-turn-helix transcriptional regulator [Nocardioides humilatus]|uniref:Helix-turn-helix transcriptional regulator n=1 Tax=Nocardioides humilatus TaxID=2607660 RepID=A0A5B1LII5_9ACTN|nr:helix-turn-helix transcriptional regulator [Nocardioides humilatus]KAA1419600.1 helix-turn-helix transcriptional regulator [Nocardioides humilatus]